MLRGIFIDVLESSECHVAVINLHRQAAGKYLDSNVILTTCLECNRRAYRTPGYAWQDVSFTTWMSTKESTSHVSSEPSASQALRIAFTNLVQSSSLSRRIPCLLPFHLYVAEILSILFATLERSSPPFARVVNRLSEIVNCSEKPFWSFIFLI